MTTERTLTRRRFVDAADIRVGDDIVFLNASHRVVDIDPYQPTAFIEQWRIARDAFGWAITLIPGERLEVVRP